LNKTCSTEEFSSTEIATTSKISALNIPNYDKIYLATKTTYYRFNWTLIFHLTENLLFRDFLPVTSEIKLLYPNREDFQKSRTDPESTALFENCVECSIDFDVVFKIIWQRIYAEQLAMRFVSLRFATYTNSTMKHLSV